MDSGLLFIFCISAGEHYGFTCNGLNEKVFNAMMLYYVVCYVLSHFPTLAHSSMKQASLLTSIGSLTNASINRSPYAYEQNPDKGK